MATKASLVERLRRRWKWGVAGLLLLLIYTLVGFLVVPRVIRSQITSKAAEYLHRDATVDEVRFNPFTLATDIEGLRLADRDGEHLLSIGSLRINLQLSGLFRRALRFREILVEHPVVRARIMPDGKPSVADLMEEKEPPADPNEPFKPPRLIVDSLDLTGGEVEFVDASRQPVYESRFQPLNLHIKDLITLPQEGGEHSITIGVAGGAELRWTGRQTVDPLRFTGRLDITGLSLTRLWDYIGQGQMLNISDGRADLALPYEIRRGDNQQFELLVDGASVAVRTLAAGPRGESELWLSVPEVRVLGVKAAWPAMRVDVNAVKIVKPQALARLGEDGVLNWAAAVPAAPSEGAPTTTPAPTTPPLTVRIESVELQEGSLRVEDRTTSPFSAIDLADLAVTARGVSTDLAAPVAFDARGSLQGSGTLEAHGTVAPAPLDATAQFELKGVNLVSLRNYIPLVPGVQITAGAAGVRGEVKASGDAPQINLTADGTVDGFELQDAKGEPLISWEKMAISKVTFADPPGRARISKVTVDRAFAKILIDPEGNLNLANLTATPEAPWAPGQLVSELRAVPAPAEEKPLDAEVGVVEIRNSAAEFSDRSLLLPFRAEVHSANGSVKDLSTTAAAPASIALEGGVDKTGYVKVGGALRLSDPFASSEVNVEFRNIEMNGLTPYFAEFAGYKVASGVLDLDVDYIVKDSRLIGNHKLVAKDLTLGDKVESSSVGLPVRLAIALLKDKDGKIDIDVPIEGAVDSPEFAYSKVFWNALKTIMGNVAKAPFRAIGRLFGRDEEDLELVEFDPGRSDLLPAEQDKLAKLAEQIGPRRELTMAVEGRFDPVTDPAALKRAKLEALIESRRAEASSSAAASGGSTLETILERLFVEQYSDTALQAEKQRFTTQAPAPAAPATESSGSGGKAPSPPQAAPPAFDAAGFYEALRGKLLAAQPVSQGELDALAGARATAIITALTGSGAVESVRVTASKPAPAKKSKGGSARVSSEMTMNAEAVKEAGGSQ